MDLKDFANIALDVDRDTKVFKMCECCEKRSSQYLYLIKSAIYGIFHICELCRNEILRMPKISHSIAFVQKDFSTFE